VKYSIHTLNGILFKVKAVVPDGNARQYDLWFKKDRFWCSWEYFETCVDKAFIEQTIYNFFGYTATLRKIK